MATLFQPPSESDIDDYIAAHPAELGRSRRSIRRELMDTRTREAVERCRKLLKTLPNYDTVALAVETMLDIAYHNMADGEDPVTGR